MSAPDPIIDPQGAGTATASPDYRVEPYQYYKLIATAATGYVLSSWDVRTRVLNSDATIRADVTQRYSSNPLEGEVFDGVDQSIPESLKGPWTTEIVSIVAHFTAVTPPPTEHGLIYSPSRDKLIYDTTSGKLCYYP